jgi:hypothetical protein
VIDATTAQIFPQLVDEGRHHNMSWRYGITYPEKNWRGAAPLHAELTIT